MRGKFSKVSAAVLSGALSVAGFAAVSASSAGAANLNTYTIAYQGPLTGGAAQLGLNMKFSVQLAINQFNANPNRPFNLAFSSADDQGDPTLAPTAAQALAADPQLVAVVGPAFSGATIASIPIYGPSNIPMVSPSATRVSITIGSGDTPAYNAQYHNFFRVVANDGVQGPANADYVVKKLKLKKLTVIDDASTYGSGLASAFAAQAKKDGATVKTLSEPETAGCSSSGTGADSQYQTISLPAGTQMVFYGGYYCDFAKLTDALRTSGYKGGLMSGDGALDPQYIAGLAKKSNGLGALLTCACSTVGGAAGDRFNSNFASLAGFPAGTYSAEAYDATNTIIAAMKKVSGPITAAAVLLQLKTITFKGLTKTVKFNGAGDVSGSAIYVNKVVKNSKGVYSIQQLGLE